LSYACLKASVGWLVGRPASQPASQKKILFNKKFLKFHINFMEGFMVHLKTFLGLAMPKQTCIDVTK